MLFMLIFDMNLLLWSFFLDDFTKFLQLLFFIIGTVLFEFI